MGLVIDTDASLGEGLASGHLPRPRPRRGAPSARFASWVGAAVALLILFAGMLPRIRVEERALAQAFGADYTDYANSTARVLPGVW
jgi:hypothetical protein